LTLVELVDKYRHRVVNVKQRCIHEELSFWAAMYMAENEPGYPISVDELIAFGELEPGDPDTMLAAVKLMQKAHVWEQMSREHRHN
jgi:hypothetical protein